MDACCVGSFKEQTKNSIFASSIWTIQGKESVFVVDNGKLKV